MEKESRGRGRPEVVRRLWTEDEGKRMLELRQMGQTPADIAKIMGASYLQVRGKLQKMGGRVVRPERKREMEPVALVKRQCLRCRNAFLSEGIFNRMCRSCKQSAGSVL